MRIATALLPGGMNWRLRPTDPALTPAANDWFVVNPLVPLLPRSPDRMMLPVDGDIMLLQHAVLHVVVPETVDHDAFLEKIETVLSHLRLLSLDAQCPSSVSGTGFQEVTQLPTKEELNGDSGLRVQFLRNRDHTATTLEKIAEAFTLSDGPPPSVHGTLVLDAIAAVTQDPRKAILYAAFAVEVLAADALNSAYDSAISSAISPSDLRIIERTVSKGASVRKDPIYEQLQAAAKRRFSLLLHELPLYMMRRSLLQDDEALYDAALTLQESRNLLAHRGTPRNGDKTFPATVKGARDALDVARRVFSWFGERDFFISM